MTRTGLDRDAVVGAAEAIVDVDGWESLTMTELAGKVGVRVPSLYNHVESIEALLGYVQIRALAELGDDLQRAAMGKVRRRGVEALALTLRDFAIRHPGRYALAMSTPIDRPAIQAAGASAGAALRAVLESYGVDFSPRLAYLCVSTLHGVLALDRSGLFRDSVRGDDVYDEAVAVVVLLIERAAKRREVPSASRRIHRTRS